MKQFGIELEGYGLTRGQIREVMEESGALHEGFFGYHGGSFHDSKVEGNYTWKTERDGSLGQGFTQEGVEGSHEIISPVLYGKQGQLHCERVWRNLMKAGFKVDRKCGTHITIGVNHNARFNRMSDAKKHTVGMRIAQVYSHFQPVFDALSSNVRNSNSQGYCRAVNFGNVFNARTSAVNLTKWALYGIVEFRQFGYTTDIKNFRGWMQLLDSLVNGATNENHKSFNKNLNDFPVTIQGMSDFLNCGAKATRWMDSRISEMMRYQQGRTNRIEVMGGEQ